MRRRWAELCLALVLVACSRNREATIVVPWSAEWGGQAIGCGKQPSALQLEDLRLFVHDVRLINAAGLETPARFIPDDRWQTDRVALIDWSPSCDREGHTEMRLHAPPGQYKALRLQIGVPFDLNHANPALAEGPLAIGAMNWSWQGGYKFLKLDGKANGQPFRLHVGSTECEGTFGHITGCHRPNRAELTLPLTAAGVALDLSALIPTGQGTAAHCESEPSADCAPMFAALGLDLKSGAAAGGQHAFRAR